MDLFKETGWLSKTTRNDFNNSGFVAYLLFNFFSDWLDKSSEDFDGG